MSIPHAAPVRRAAGAFTGVNAYGFPILRNCPRVERGGQRGRNISHRTSAQSARIRVALRLCGSRRRTRQAPQPKMRIGRTRRILRMPCAPIQAVHLKRALISGSGAKVHSGADRRKRSAVSCYRYVNRAARSPGRARRDTGIPRSEETPPPPRTLPPAA